MLFRSRSRYWVSGLILTIFPSQAHIPELGNDLWRQRGEGILTEMFHDNLGALLVGHLCRRSLRRHHICQVALHRNRDRQTVASSPLDECPPDHVVFGTTSPVAGVSLGPKRLDCHRPTGPANDRLPLAGWGFYESGHRGLQGVRLYLVCTRCTRTVPEIVPEPQCTIQHSIFQYPRIILKLQLFISFCWTYFFINLVPGGGVEPPRPCDRRILSPHLDLLKLRILFVHMHLQLTGNEGR